ncbi:amino acid/amide ABC transporter membrane protein 2, HAAT family [Tistlia consotensis]|uniref:Amino acid/amide ABC transporter membrane protein 2, HAAT family n=1 Tax=Tistlia consotensis USBA 355 TaxID=560819 RepID=A0A1Y6CCE7_9PROT|nr:branched-chain amino acid ABC transporter permease [Tistlia consotensis]SMF55753.1 amino acid/amide ABC transporter membrane protein 2, HAAT family [Tistlia consotensis USBA 355]SNR89166.1 amino acid/amide ABC transporter membrane protein 2, HAAT family [Tistlia consotensis]
MSAGRRDLLVCLLLAGAMALLPQLVGTRYVVTQSTLFFIWAVVVSQWNLVFGVAGIFSLAQMALFAVGAYATAMLGYYFAVPMVVAMPLAALVSVAVSLVVGLACLRLRGPYVALLTLAIAQVLYLVVVNDTDCFTNPPSGCMPFFGGVRGFSRFGDLGFRALLGSKWYVAHYYVGLGLLTLAMLFSIAIVRGPLGLAFQALRDNPGYARSRGVGQFKYQLWVFGLSAFFTGLAGAFYGVQFGVVGPIVFSLATLLFLLSMMVVGGLGTVWGPLLGAALLMLADEGMREVGDWRDIGLGVILVLFVVLLPRGLAGLRLRGVSKAKQS